MEAFQTMSAFFVHDLKNTASTLSLMLQNLPAHFADPSFREDALRGLGKSVTRINELISRLGALRQELSLKLAPVNVNLVVARAIESLGGARAAQLSQQLASTLPEPYADADQLQKVIVNLLVNAFEAVGEGGQVRVSTSQRGNWVVMSVTDNGCGMSAEFMSRSLFRPFQTTKKKGIGIGMFLTKSIVEAHHGKIEVQSESGKGSTFEVLLPLQQGPE
jgi:signal transduction histidine kinase